MATKFFFILAIAIMSVSMCSGRDEVDPQNDTCTNISSCASCLSKSYCTWCVTKSKCTKQACGYDNVIYPKHIKALMAGPQFCPRIVTPEKELVFESGKKQIIVVKITQIYLYMAFTPWKCLISLDEREMVVNAVLLGDEVICDSLELESKSSKAYSTGSVTVMWENSKSFDGQILFKVCRCDMDPNCAACKK